MSSDATNFEWTDVHLGDIASIFPGFGFKSKDFQPSGIPIVKIKNVKAGEISLHSLDHVDFEFENTHQKYLVKKGDLLITLSGNRYDGSPETWVGKVAYFGHLGKFLLNQRVAFIRANDPCHVDHRFLSYLLSSYQYQYEFISIATSSGGQANLSSKQVNDVQLALPPYPEQKAIAHILGTLDDKIELNRQTNKTLEAMARAIFKSWFVDFDPVHAKRARKGGGQSDANAAVLSLSPDILDLFPDSFQDSELGEIPAGWVVSSIGELADCVGGGTPSTKNPDFWDNGQNAWATPKDMAALSDPILLDTARSITDAGLVKISSGLLPGDTVLMSSRAPVGYLAINCIPVAINQGFIALKCGARISPYFAINWCSENMEQIESRASGTTFLEISKKNFKPMFVVVPTTDLMASFTQTAKPIYEKIESNCLETNRLIKLRDTLLSKLISGELRIKDAEKFLKEAPL